MSKNPYAAPQVDVLPTDLSGDVAIRNAHIKTESSIRSIGLLNYVGAILLLPGLFDSKPLSGTAEATGYFLGFLMVPILLVLAGHSIRRLQKPGRNLNTLFFAISLFAFPVGTLIGAYALYLLFCQKGRTIFSAPYKEVIANTPHIKYGTSKAAWIVLIVFLLFIVLGFFWLGSQ